MKMNCSNCGGKALCKEPCPRAGKLKTLCVHCSGSALCKPPCANAGKRKYYCVDCCSVALIQRPALCAAHCTNSDHPKAFCKQCDGSLLCVVCEFFIVKRKGNKCSRCNPKGCIKSREREKPMAAQLEIWAERGLIPLYDYWNKQNLLVDPLQCGHFKADFFFDFQMGVLMLEFDEYQNMFQNKRCELLRMLQMALGYGGRHVIFIRYNPNAFKVKGKRFKIKGQDRPKQLLDLLQAGARHEYGGHFITVHYVCYDSG